MNDMHPAEVWHFLHHRRIEFAETDMARICHFSHYFRFMEAAEARLFRSLDLPWIAADSTEPGFGWPRVKASFRFEAPLLLGDLIRIALRIEKIRERGLRYASAIWKAGNSPGEWIPVARGEMGTAYVEAGAQPGELRSAPIPPRIREKLGQAPVADWKSTATLN